MSTIKFKFFWIFWKFILKMQFFFFHSLVALRRSHFQCGKCEGRRSQSSEARTPSLALPPRWARKEFFVVVCGAVLTFVCMLRYSEWNAVPIWFLDSSVFIVRRCADLIPRFFCIYSGTLYWYSYTSTIPGQDAPRPLPSPARVLSFFLSVGNVSQRERISVRAVAEEGWYNLGCGRGRYCGRVSCLSQRRVLALPQCF